MAILTKEQLEKERKKLWGSLSEAPTYFDINKPGYVVDQDALKEVNKWVKFSKGGEELNPEAAKLLKITPVDKDPHGIFIRGTDHTSNVFTKHYKTGKELGVMTRRQRRAYEKEAAGRTWQGSGGTKLIGENSKWIDRNDKVIAPKQPPKNKTENKTVKNSGKPPEFREVIAGAINDQTLISKEPSSPYKEFNRKNNPSAYPQPGQGQQRQYEAEPDGQLKLPIKGAQNPKEDKRRNQLLIQSMNYA